MSKNVPTLEIINNAVAILQKGGLVAFPTETVYGLGADATNNTAVAKIFSAKGRPQFNPLISHISSIEDATKLGVFSKRAMEIAKYFWPGPLTLILNRTLDCPVSWLASAGLKTIALRIPDHPVANELLKRVNRPIVAPSANRSGKISPTRPDHVLSELNGKVEVILDGGECRVGLESTVLDMSGRKPILLRPGHVTQYELEEKLGLIGRANINTEIMAPGMLESHYAPDCKVRLNATSTTNNEVFLGFGKNSEHTAKNLSVEGNLSEAAANLFQMMRELDGKGVTGIAVAPIPEHGLGIAINDRLKRAAASR